MSDSQVSEKISKRVTTPQMQSWIDQSQGMVRAIASKIYARLPKQVSFDDLVAYGQLGLLQAAHSFDPTKNVAFQTFAYYRIRGAIYDGIGKMSWMSRHVLQRIRAEKLSAEMMYEQVSASEQASQSSLEEDASWFARTTERVAIIHLLSANQDEDGIEQAAESEEPTPEEAAEHSEVCSLLRGHVEGLPHVERQLIEKTYFQNQTLTQAATELGKSKSWASRIHTRILEKLAQKLAQNGVPQS